MSTQVEKLLSEEETEILQEIMNIAFGKSAADLADVIETHVVLSVPYIKIIQITELPVYFKDNVKEYKKISIVEQKFWGRFKGEALLVFSSGAGRELIRMLQQDEGSGYESDPVEILEGESLMEVGNILIGACVGKLTEVLKDVVTYAPPMVIVEKEYAEAIAESRYDPNSTAIVLKTEFRFEEGNVSGFLFLITSQESVSWLKNALHVFMEQYE
jgi:chemotaxis protein CheC